MSTATTRSTNYRSKASERRNSPVRMIKPGDPDAHVPLETASASVPVSTSLHPAESGQKSGLEAEVVTVTPDMALAWLEQRGDNRPIHQLTVDRYADSMRRGEWQLTGEAVKLSQAGKVLDGQHRLWACVESGVSFTTLVILNVPEQAFDVMDSGRARSSADVLGIHKATQTRALASAIRHSIIWERDGYLHEPGSHVPAPTKPQVLQFWRDHPEIEEWINQAKRLQRAHLYGSTGVFVSVFWQLARVSRKDLEPFIDGLVTGADLQHGDPILALRNRLIGHHDRSEGSYVAEELAGIIIKAWNAFRQGKNITILTYRRGGPTRENFPVIV